MEVAKLTVNRIGPFKAAEKGVGRESVTARFKRRETCTLGECN